MTDKAENITPQMAVGDTRVCFESHMGVYAMEPRSLENVVSRILAFGLQPQPQPVTDSRGREIQVIDGTALVHITDAITKKPSKFGGTSAQATGILLRQLAEEPAVEKIALVIDSPGGSVKGVDDLAAVVGKVNATKPVIAFCEDMACSAAYWIASQASEIVANRSALVGSLGAFSVVYDTSEKAAREGVKVHVISSGGVKGAGQPGAPFTDEQRAALQGVIDTHTSIFKSSVKEGRGMSDKDVEALFDGRVFGAKEALALGLIDRIGTLESVFGSVEENSNMPDESGTVSVEELTGGPVASEVVESAPVATEPTETPKAEDKPVPPEKKDEDEAEEEDKKGGEEASKPSAADVTLSTAASEDTTILAELSTLLVDAGCPVSEAGIRAALAEKAGDRKEMYAEFARLSRIAPAGSASNFETTQPKASVETSPVEEFEKAVKALEAGGLNRSEAVLSVIGKNPELHQAYLAASQSK